MLFVMFFVARWDYTRLYTNVYSESANVRVDIANRSVSYTHLDVYKRQVPDKDRKAFATDLKTIYQAADEKKALAALDRVMRCV